MRGLRKPSEDMVFTPHPLSLYRSTPALPAVPSVESATVSCLDTTIATSEQVPHNQSIHTLSGTLSPSHSLLGQASKAQEEGIASALSSVALQARQPTSDNRTPSIDVSDRIHSPIEESGKAQTALEQQTDTVHTIKILRFLRGGDIWGFWLAEHPVFGQVCLKFVNIDHPPPTIYDIDDPEAPGLDILEEALKEERMYLNILKPVQGSLVPHYYGLYQITLGLHRDHAYLAMILEFVGWPIGPYYPHRTQEMRSATYAAYQELHLLGVLHENLCGRHVLMSRTQDDELKARLVGFRYASLVDPTQPEGVIELVEEAGAVRSVVGLTKLKTLNMKTEVPAYWSKLEDPDAFLALYD
ncbi:uncharacterized protein IL334_002806 [Kwoniella shivajii]|uniref:Protein kinase domain-containing protein n=1 Tax=Kwoniella shivajii TaxID=564305 RepID=A0ABZ1CXF7_9TREE|nr:hypothetical protein IL334_002806 [Kwoniella shivajii]